MPQRDNSVEYQITQLQSLERSELTDAWIKANGTPPFKGARNGTLIRGLAYYQQCKVFGAIKPSVSRKLLKIARSDVSANTPTRGASTTKPRTKPGSQIIREWNGRTHTVHVTDKGYVMGGITYRSLSAAAKAITGSHWSGPRFFGVAG